MNRIFRIPATVLSVAAAGMLLSSGCTKEGSPDIDGASLNFSAGILEVTEVKAAAQTSANDFYIKGYDSGTQWFPSLPAAEPEHVVMTGSSKTYDSYKWKKGDTKTFYAWSNNLPANATASVSNTGVTLSYTAIPAGADVQTDVMLGLYSGNGNNTGTAALNFRHPLAQVVFVTGDVTSVSAISSITIEGVYNAGTATLGSSGSVSWSSTGGSANVSQTVSGALPSTGGQIGIPFMLIPQDLTANNVTVKVACTISGAQKTLKTTFDSGVFATGKKTSVRINFKGADKVTFTVGVTAWDSNEGGSADAEAVGLLSFDGVALDGWQDVNSGELDL